MAHGGYVICVPCNIYNLSIICLLALIWSILTQYICVWASLDFSTLLLIPWACSHLLSGTFPYSLVSEHIITLLYGCCLIVLYIEPCCAHHLLYFLYIKHPLVRLGWWVVCSVKSSLRIGILGIVIGIPGIVYTYNNSQNNKVCLKIYVFH
jgi:hypothetical protein